MKSKQSSSKRLTSSKSIGETIIEDSEQPSLLNEKGNFLLNFKLKTHFWKLNLQTLLLVKIKFPLDLHWINNHQIFKMPMKIKIRL